MENPIVVTVYDRDGAKYASFASAAKTESGAEREGRAYLKRVGLSRSGMTVHVDVIEGPLRLLPGVPLLSN